MTTAGLVERVGRLCDEAASRLDAPADAQVRALRARLDEPLRVAIVGRAKAGKSTLLNALVGERLAATDAGESTRVPTWYRHGRTYEVVAAIGSGDVRPVRFRRNGHLEILLDEGDRAAIERLEVRWPAARLERIVFVDTPGLASTDEVSAARTLRVLGLDSGEPGEVDAVIYLVRHLHSRDVDFLEAFLDRSVAEPSPVNAIAVLSRVDEIGGGRLDALASAAAVASRLAVDERIRSRCATLIPVAGLLAETGASLRESEAAVLRELAGLPEPELDALLLSVDRLVDPTRTSIPASSRSDLLERLGLFGVRWSVAAFRSGSVHGASDLSRALREASGIERLAELLERHFAARASVLKARAAFVGLRIVAAALPAERGAEARWLLGELEAIEASAHELAELRLWHLLLSGTIKVGAGERHELELLTSEGDPATRLGLPVETSPGTLRDEAAARAERWRDRGAHPLTSRELADACEIVAHSYERIHAALTEDSVAPRSPSA